MMHVFVIDEQPPFWVELGKLLMLSDIELSSHTSLREAKERVEHLKPILVVMNVSLPDGNGIEESWRLRQTSHPPEIILISESPSADEAEQAIRSGAWDYLPRNTAPDLLATMIPQIGLLYRSRLQAGHGERKTTPFAQEIIGASPRMRSCLGLCADAARSDASVLISGETGTGKELLAYAIHSNGTRQKRNFVVVDCAALPESLVESLLFGHERGAFTGADRSQEGLISQADGGTLFLDEIGELPMAAQKSFLRVLQEGRFRRVGGTQEIESDFRLISATNKNVEQMVIDGTFREDLLFRIRSFMIEVPPLRERREDIPSIVAYHLERMFSRMGTAPKEVAPELFDALDQYTWPGNIRELVHALDRAISAALHEPIILPQHLPTYIRVHLARVKSDRMSAPGERAQDPVSSWQSFKTKAMEEAEKKYLRSLLSIVNADMDAACRMSGLSRSRLYALLKKHSLQQ